VQHLEKTRRIIYFHSIEAIIEAIIQKTIIRRKNSEKLTVVWNWSLTTTFKTPSSRSDSISSETDQHPEPDNMATAVETPQEERTNLSDVFSFFEKGGAKKSVQKENVAMKTHLQFEAIRRAGTASYLKDKFEGGEEEDEEEEEEEEEDYFTRTTKDPNLVKCERVNPKKKKNISAEIQLDSRGLREQFDSGQMMGNYTTSIDERAREIEEMRKLKADGIKDTWESKPVQLEGVTRASEQIADDFLLEAGRGDKAFNSRMIRNEFNRKAKGLQGPGARKAPRAITPPREGEKVYENEPVVLEGVVRANDPKDDPVLINRGGARSLREKFTNIIDEENKPKRKGPRAITPPGGIEDVYENTPADAPEGCVRSSDKSANIEFQKGRISSFAEGFMAAAEDASKSKRSRNRIEIVRDGAQEVFESNPEESLSDARASDKSESVQTRGLARSMRDKFFEDVEDRRRSVKKTQIVIDHTNQDTFENNPDESHADYKASDKMDSIPTRGLAKTMTEKFFQDVETRGKVRKTQIVIDRDGNQEVFENDPEGHFADSTWEQQEERLNLSRGYAGAMKEKFFEDVQERQMNIKRTAIDIPELHENQHAYDTAVGQKQRKNRTGEIYGFGGVAGEDTFENEPEESSADVRSSLTREERRASRGGYAKQMQQQFLQDAESRQKNIRRTQIDIPREGAIQDVFENNPEESGADIRAGQEIHEVIQTKGLAKSMAMRAQKAAEDASSVKTSSQRLPAPKKFVEYENVGVKAKSRQEYCGICQGPVYPRDRLDLGKMIIHEQCFKCLKCGLKLTNNNFAMYGDALLCKAHYHQLFQIKGNYTELARSSRYAISGSTEKLIQAGEITEEEAKQMMLIQAEVDQMVAEQKEQRGSQGDEDEEQNDDFNYSSGFGNDYSSYYNQEESEEAEDDSYSYSYSGFGGSYGNYGNYSYQSNYDEDEEEETAEEDKYQNKLD